MVIMNGGVKWQVIGSFLGKYVVYQWPVCVLMI